MLNLGKGDDVAETSAEGSVVVVTASEYNWQSNLGVIEVGQSSQHSNIRHDKWYKYVIIFMVLHTGRNYAQRPPCRTFCKSDIS